MTNNDAPLIQAGQVSIDECILLQQSGDSISFIEQLVGVTIYEDLYSPFTTGFITVNDTLDIPGFVGRAGRDMLKLKIRTPGFPSKSAIDSYFIVYKMSDRTVVRDRLQGYNLHFASSEFAIDAVKSISKTFTGTPSSIVTGILESQLGSTKKLDVEPTSNTIRYTSNFWNPSKNFSYCAQHATNTNRAASYMFWENRYGFNFKSLESLVDAPLLQTFYGNDFTTDTNTVDGSVRFATAKRNPEKAYQSLEGIKIDVSYDYLKDYAAGMIKTKMYAHDLVRKRIDVRKFDLNDDSMVRMNKNKFYTDDVINTTDPLLMSMSRHTNVNDKGDVTDFRWKQQRMMQMGQYRSGIVEIEVYGRSDYTVGTRVKLDLNRMIEIEMKDTKDKYWDRMYSGDYIITAIAHRITRDEHRCFIELSKPHTNLN